MTLPARRIIPIEAGDGNKRSSSTARPFYDAYRPLLPSALVWITIWGPRKRMAIILISSRKHYTLGRSICERLIIGIRLTCQLLRNLKTLVPGVRRAVSTTVRMAASPSAAHMAR